MHSPAIRFSKLLTVFCLAVLIGTCLPATSRAAEDALPEAVRAQLHTPLEVVGTSTYRRFGFRVYRAVLWAPQGKWDATKPYALQLCYTRSVSKDTMVDTVADDIKDQNVADDATFARWHDILNKTLPDVEDGDSITGISVPAKNALLFHNETKIASIDDPAFSRAFFNIWLGSTADEDMRNDLMGKK